MEKRLPETLVPTPHALVIHREKSEDPKIHGSQKNEQKKRKNCSPRRYMMGEWVYPTLPTQAHGAPKKMRGEFRSTVVSIGMNRNSEHYSIKDPTANRATFPCTTRRAAAH